MNKIVTLSICLTAFINSFFGQTKYWVKFNTKSSATYTYNIANPSAFLSSKSILRRTTYNIPVDQTDLPVNPDFVAQVEAVAGVTVLYASKWINGVVVSLTNINSINAINAFTFVANSNPVNKYKVTIPVMAVPEANLSGKTIANPSAFSYGRSYWQNAQIGVDCLHSQGYRGQGMTIAVLDAGFSAVDVNPVFDSLRNRGGILGTRDFVTGGNSVYEDDTHGAAVLSCMAAIKPNVIMGSAPRADYWLLRTEDNASPSPLSESPSEEYNWIRGAEFADSVGADILTTSLGYTTFDKSQYNHTYSQLNGKTAHMSIAATMASRKGMLVLNAAGNEGSSPWQYIGVPADADSIITVGAIDSLYNVASFSSVGPTSDGRIKPDLMARGVSSWVSYTSDGSCYPNNGTSFATPILAGAVACFWQTHKIYNNIKIMDTLKHTASHATNPNNFRGWGTPNMCAIPAGLGADKTLNSFEMEVMPNPFSSNVKVTIPSLNLNGVNLQIINSLGSVIKTVYSPVTNNAVELDLSELSGGIYFIKVSTSQGTAIKKVIRQ